MLMIGKEKEQPFSGCNVWFSPDIAQCKELKSLVEGYGGKVRTRLSSKVNFVVAKKRTDDLDAKIGKYSLSVIPESFVRDSIKTNTPLPLFISHFGDLQQKENYPNHVFSSPSSPVPSSASNPLSSGLPYSPTPSHITQATPTTPPSASFPTSSTSPLPSSSTQPPRSPHGIRERLKGLSLKPKNKQQPPPSPGSSPRKAISKTPPTSAQRTRTRNAARALCETLHVLPSKKSTKDGEKDDDGLVDPERPLQGLVFVVYGTFSMPREMIEHLILSHGGKFEASLTDEVTHLLFGGENIDVGELVQAKEKRIHIVNEYFLRLLIKY
eukprot:Phypoly_transcript_02070.p2 GENE.Phypoly_transcript_02070~~Phypoly_transcript_02070.p2  ORF type:complete len:325 (+),score=82.16 Phypoly_transcript_02070:140-1114(+)